MKALYYSLALLISSASISNAAMALTGGDSNNGIVDSAGVALGNGTLRFGTFVSGYTPSASDSQATINGNFREVYGYTGPISYFGIDGFYDFATSYDETASFGGTPYDSSATNVDVPGDISGSKIYLWVLDNSDPLLATQQLIMSNNQLWGDSDNLDPFGGIVGSAFSWESTNPSLVADIGSIATVPSLVNPGSFSHQLENIAAIPEPSRAMLAGLGLCVAFFRRRRRA
jgi:hypothetical protein